MQTIDEARRELLAAKDRFGMGSWQDLVTSLQPLFDHPVLEGAEHAELAFYLGYAHARLGHTMEAVPPLETAAREGSPDFSVWAEEELAALRADGTAGAGPADHGIEEDVAAARETPAPPGGHGHVSVDVSNHPILRRGSTDHEWVAHLQAKLAHLHYPVGPVDGTFGSLTDAAVRSFQTDHGLAADGLVGPLTWSALEDLAPGITGTPQAAPAPGPAPAPAPSEATATHPDGGDTGTTPTPEPAGPTTPAAVHSWEPVRPDFAPPVVGEVQPESTPVALADEIELSTTIPIDRSYGPVTLKELVLRASGKLITGNGEYVSVTYSDGTKRALKIDTASLNLFKASGWEGNLRGNAEISESGGITGVLEIKNEPVILEFEFTLVKRDKDRGEWAFAELTGSGGVMFENEPITVDGETMYLSGKLTAGLTLAPNWVWIAENLGRAAVQAGAGAGAGVAAAETIPTGAAAVTAAEVVTLTGFVAGAVAVLYVGYHNMNDIEGLKRLQSDAGKAVDDFAAGFASVWGSGSSPGGFWGDAGASAGQRQLDADLAAYRAYIEAEARKPERTDLRGLVVDDALIDSVREQWRATVAEKGDAFRSVVAAMFGKMIRTAVCEAFLRANPTSSLPGDPRHNAQNYAGIPDGGSTHPDVRAALAAATSANLQLNIERWQHALDE